MATITEPQDNVLYKIILLGDCKVGKTVAMNQLLQGHFDELYRHTIAVDFLVDQVQLGSRSFKIQVWDTPGKTVFRKLAQLYSKGTHGVIIMFDITNRESFDSIDVYLSDFVQQNEDIAVLIVGAKSDLSSAQEVSTEEARSKADAYKIGYVEMNSRDKDSVKDVFESLLLKVRGETKTSTALHLNEKISFTNDRAIVIGEPRHPTKEQIHEMKSLIKNRSTIGLTMYLLYLMEVEKQKRIC